MLSAGRRRFGRDALCVLAGILVALCVAAPVAELRLSVASDGPDTPGLIAKRLYEGSEGYAVEREQPMIQSLGGRSDEFLFGPCELAVAIDMPPRDDDPRRIIVEAITRWENRRSQLAFEEPALDGLVKRSPLLLKALDGCVRASLLAAVCGRYVMAIAAQARDGRRDAIFQAQESVARTAEAAFCLAGGRGTITAPRPAR